MKNRNGNKSFGKILYEDLYYLRTSILDSRYQSMSDIAYDVDVLFTLPVLPVEDLEGVGG